MYSKVVGCGKLEKCFETGASIFEMRFVFKPEGCLDVVLADCWFGGVGDIGLGLFTPERDGVNKEANTERTTLWGTGVGLGKLWEHIA